MENLAALLQLFVRPARAMSRILDHGNWVFGVIAALIVSFALSQFQPVLRIVPMPGPPPPLTPEQQFALLARSTSTVLIVFCIFVPACLAAITLIDRLGAVSTVLFRDYAALLACCSFAWIAARVVMGALDGIVPSERPAIAAVAMAYFLVLMVIAIQVLTGAGVGSAIGAILVAGGITGFLIGTNILGFVIPYLASPFFLFWGYRYFSGDLQSLGQGLSSRQHFRRQLELATINPHDADAQVQLGLIYQARRQYGEAADRFRKALAIDPNEPEAHLQLGRIERDLGHFDQALPHFQAVAKTNPKFSLSEVWREAGSVYIALKRYSDAKPVLEHYLAQRPFDAEGLYYLGAAHEGLNDRTEARSAYERCIEAVRTAPSHRRRFVNRWGREAQKRLRAIR